MDGDRNDTGHPSGLPTGAEWDAKQKAWRVGETDEDGRLVGLHRVFRGDGSLESEATYAGGLLHGAFFRFHPNGELAREGRFERGVPVGTTIAYASTAPTPELLQPCCVPQGAWKMTREQLGGRDRERYFDREGRKLLFDGTPQPVAPDSVPADADYRPSQDEWEHGAEAEPGGRSTWRRWTASGVSLEQSDYRDGKLDGLCVQYTSGILTSSWTYSAGTLEGPGYERALPGTFQDVRIAVVRGQHRAGTAVGTWRYCNADDEVLYTVCLDGDAISELVSSLRRASRLDDDAALTALLGDIPPMTDMATEAVLQGVSDTAQLHMLLMRGARAGRVFCAWARNMADAPEVGLELATLALKLEPDAPEAMAVTVLFLSELGRPEDAISALARLTLLAPDASPPLTDLLRVTFSPFSFLPATCELDDAYSPELPSDVVQTTKTMRRAISKAALRLASVRHALANKSGSPAPTWLPPEVSHLVEPGTELESYTFVIEAAEGADNAKETVRVDERLPRQDLGGRSAGNLLRQARREWATLCWLCYAAGLDHVALPEEVRPPATFEKAITTAFARHFRAEDQLQTGGLRARTKGYPPLNWEGIPLDALTGPLLAQACHEYLEMRTALYFAADDTCQSVWQDDLRG